MSCEPFLDGCLSRTPPEGSCTRIRDAAELVVAASVELLAPFFCPGSRCNGITGIMTHDIPAVEFDNKVAVYVESIAPLDTSAHVGLPNQLEATLGIQLWLDGYPVGEEQGNLYYPPSPDLIHEASRLSMVIGETWYTGLARLIAANADACAGWQLQNLTTLRPSGQFVGWETGLRVLL